METKEKLSKFETKIIAKLENDVDNKKVANRSYKSAKSKIETEIALLEGKRVEVENNIDEAEENLEEIKFSTGFNLVVYDDALESLQELKDDLENIDKTIKLRKELLEEWI